MLLFFPVGFDGFLEKFHRHEDGIPCLLGRQETERFFRRQFDIHTHPVYIPSQFIEKGPVRARYALHVDVTVEMFPFPQKPGCLDEKFRGVVRGSDDA